MKDIAFLPIGPEVVLLGAALAVLLLEVAFGMGRRVWGVAAGGSLVTAFVLSLAQWMRVSDIGPQLNFAAVGSDVVRAPMIVMDHFSAFAGLVLFAAAGIALLGAAELIASLESRGAEFVALALLSAAGMHLMASSANLIMLFIGLETASIALYVVAGFTRERLGADEAAMKYFLLGSFASAVFLYGIALVFAATGSTSLYGVDSIRRFLGTTVIVQPGVLLAGIALLIVGLGFKVSAAPFHQWAPDVYEGAPGGAVGFMAAGVKIAGFAALGRVLVGGMPARIDDWAPAVAAVAAVSIVLGTLLAIAQTDLKRMLAYSGVAHAGFILTALVAGAEGVPSMWFYLSTYAFQLIGAFAVAAVVGGVRQGGAGLEQLTGLSLRVPAVAAVLALMMLAMGGIPFTSGFVGKVAVFTAAIDAGYLWLVIVGLVASVAGLYFYLRVVVLMYFQAPLVVEGPGAATAAPEPSRSTLAVLGVTSAVTVVLGVVPWPLLEFVRDALPL